MSWDEVKDEKEGYVRVRKSDDQSLNGRLKEANDNSEAKGFIELNKEDLGGMSGGGGPHSHSEYSPKTHTHAEYQPVGDYADAQALAQHLANHPSGDGGDSYDDTQLKQTVEKNASDISKNRQKIDNIQQGQNSQDVKISALETGKADADHTHPDSGSYDDTEVRALIQGNTDSLDDKSKIDHTHPADPRLDALEQSQDEQDARLDALESDDCGSIMGHFVNGWNYYEDGGAEARDFNIKLHKPSSSKGGENGDIDDRDVWETTGSLQQGDIVYFKVGDEVYEREYSRRSELQHYYDLVFTEKVDFVPKDTEFFIMDNPECVEEIPEHDHEGMVVSDSVTTIVRLTEAEYEALADKDPSTLYLVV